MAEQYACVSVLYSIHAVAYDRSMASASQAAAKRRLSRDDWTRAALDAIADKGLAAVAVEPLAARLGVTKGSFYAHFSSRDELVEAALANWRRSHGSTDLERFNAIEDPAARLQAVLLAAVTFSQSGSPSVHVALLGELGDPRVREAVAGVTQSRIRLLARTYRELGFATPQAADRARLTYATYLGLLQMAREAPQRRLAKRELRRFVAEMNLVLIQTGAEHASR
jgi:AcrR family transcriptional regulator